jgi:hypothetical protein
MLDAFTTKLETYLNTDEELQRRLAGFKHFSGVPDGHYKRARAQGISAVARAVKCYPFGGKSLLGDCEIVGIHIDGLKENNSFAISLKDQKFSIENGDWKNPHLTIALSKELFKKTVLGRYRWLWTIGMEEVKIGHSDGLPHSDWVTILEVLVAMQELVEFDKELWQTIESL